MIAQKISALTVLVFLGMPVGIMKTSYFAIAALGVAAIALCNMKFGLYEPRPVPSYPVPSEPARTAAVELPPLPNIPKALFPDINPPPDETLAIPLSTPMIPIPSTNSTDPQAPPLIQIPTVPTPIETGSPNQVVSTATGTSTPEPLPASPLVPSVPTVPQVATPMTPPVASSNVPPSYPAGQNVTSVSNPLDAPNSPASVNAPKPPALPASPGSVTADPYTPHGKFVVLRGKPIDASPDKKLIGEIMASKLLTIEGIGAMDKKDIVVQQGAIVRNIPKTEVLFVGETHNDVYCFMRDRAPANDEIARLAVARWCMFNGMREQALAEATAILQFKPACKVAADLARSLQESLKQFPPEGANLAVKQSSTLVNVSENEVEITPEAATLFATRIQPILANLCIDCHARSDYAGTFKLARVSEFETSPQKALINLRATAGQLLKSDPINSPLLAKAIVTHGGLKQPTFQSKQAPGFRVLENWAVLAVGPVAPAAVGGSQPALPATQPTQPLAGTAPIGAATPTQPTIPAPPAGLPPVETTPVLPAANPMTSPSASLPAIPSTTVAVPAVTVPAVLPTPPMMKPTVPSQPPIVPAVDTTPNMPNPPMVPPQHPISIPAAPTVPSGAAPVNGTVPGSQFGTSVPAKPINPSVPAGRDEFDPSIFNQGNPKK